jgi:hypothetical protein
VQWNQQRVASFLPQDQSLGLAQAGRLSPVLVDQAFRMKRLTNSTNSLSSSSSRYGS